MSTSGAPMGLVNYPSNSNRSGNRQGPKRGRSNRNNRIAEIRAAQMKQAITGLAVKEPIEDLTILGMPLLERKVVVVPKEQLGESNPYMIDPEEFEKKLTTGDFVIIPDNEGKILSVLVPVDDKFEEYIFSTEIVRNPKKSEEIISMLKRILQTSTGKLVGLTKKLIAYVPMMQKFIRLSSEYISRKVERTQAENRKQLVYYGLKGKRKLQLDIVEFLTGSPDIAELIFMSDPRSFMSNWRTLQTKNPILFNTTAFNKEQQELILATAIQANKLARFFEFNLEVPMYAEDADAHLEYINNFVTNQKLTAVPSILQGIDDPDIVAAFFGKILIEAAKTLKKHSQSQPTPSEGSQVDRTSKKQRTKKTTAERQILELNKVGSGQGPVDRRAPAGPSGSQSTVVKPPNSKNEEQPMTNSNSNNEENSLTPRRTI